MRQFVFAIVLVGAAFGGGAMVNGPGFQWAQDHFFNYMGLKDGGEIASIALPPVPGDDDATGAIVPKVERAATDEELGMTSSRRKPRPQAIAEEKPAPSPETKAPDVVASAEPSPTPTLAGPAGAPGPGPAPSAPPAPLDPGVAPALLASLSPAPSGLPPVPAPVAEPDSEVKKAAAGSAGGDWAELRAQLKAQGVTRYTIEAETGGRVVFSCLIPLAGKQAVSQRFEAEGDDEFAAAHATLRRIKLWRATRTPAAASAS